MQPSHRSEETSKPGCDQTEGRQILTCPQWSLLVGSMMAGRHLPWLLPLTLGDRENSCFNASHGKFAWEYCFPETFSVCKSLVMVKGRGRRTVPYRKPAAVQRKAGTTESRQSAAVRDGEGDERQMPMPLGQWIGSVWKSRPQLPD